MELSAHLLMIILDYSSPPTTAAAPAQLDAPPTSGQQEATPTQEDAVFADEHHQASVAENLFKLYISKLHQKEVIIIIPTYLEVTVFTRVLDRSCGCTR